jgi:heme exporter protein B
MSPARLAWAIAVKDLRIEARGRYAAGMAVPFAATLLIAFGLSLGPGRTLLEATAPGLLWLAVLFASTLLARRAWEAEAQDGALEGLLLAPVDKAVVFAGKAIALAVQLLALEVAVPACGAPSAATFPSPTPRPRWRSRCATPSPGI